MQQNYRLILVVDEFYGNNGPEKKIVEGILYNMPNYVDVHIVRASVSLIKRINVLYIKAIQREIEELINENTVVMPISCTVGYEVRHLLRKHRNVNFVCFFVDCSSYGVYSTLKNASTSNIQMPLSKKTREIYRMLVWYFKESILLKLYPKVLFITNQEIEHAKKIHRNIKSDMFALRFAVDCIPEKSCRLHDYEKELAIGIIATFGYSTFDVIIKWFLDTCDRELISLFPNIKVVIAGRNATKEQISQMQKYRFVNYLGEVDSLLNFYNRVDIIVSADLREVGIFTKIVEAFSFGKCVVGFRKNFSPIEGCIEHENYIPADNAEDLKTVFNDIVEGKIDVDFVGENARTLVKEQYIWRSSCQELDKILRE